MSSINRKQGGRGDEYMQPEKMVNCTTRDKCKLVSITSYSKIF